MKARPETDPSPSTTSSLLVFATALGPMTWGTTYYVTTEFLPPGRPLLAGAIRALLAGAALVLLERRRPAGRWWAKAAVLGLLNVGLFFACLFVAAYRLPGGVAATLGAIQPLIAAVLAAVLLRERLSVVVIGAGLLGIAGVFLLVGESDTSLNGFGVAAGLIGAASMATGVVLTKRWGSPVGIFAFTGWQMLAGGMLLLPAALVHEGVPDDLSARNLLGYVWLALVGGAFAYTMWFRGVRVLQVARTSLLALLSPVVAAVVGLALLDQSLTLGQGLGMASILIAVWLGQGRGAVASRLWARLHAR